MLLEANFHQATDYNISSWSCKCNVVSWCFIFEMCVSISMSTRVLMSSETFLQYIHLCLCADNFGRIVCIQ